MSRVVKAAFAYVIPVFVVAFALGAIRVVFIAPEIGPLAAVSLEVPVVLILSWLVAVRFWHIGHCQSGAGLQWARWLLRC